MIISIIISIIGASSIASGAILKHVLMGQLSPSELQVYSTAVTYHQLMSVVLLISLIAKRVPQCQRLISTTTIAFFLIGVVLFSGSLYAYIPFKITALMFITPIGGLCMMLGWVSIAINAIRHQSR